MDNQVERGPNLAPASIAHYFLTRIPTLKPPPFKERKHLLNPLPPLRKISLRQWSFIGVAFFGWTWDAFDFFSVSLTVTDLAETFGKTVTQISWGITVVLMLRSVGAVLFGLAADKWGRKWPFIINILMFIALELGTGFSQTYKQFLACRALFGIAMGGIYGNCAATALEDTPIEARGIISGFLQQGYAFGYLLVVCFNQGLNERFNPKISHEWRPLYWFGAAVPVLIIAWRLCLGESNHYIQARAEQKGQLGQTFMKQAKKAVKTHWLMMIYLVLLMTGMNYMSHGSQDLYPTRLTKQLQFSTKASTVTNSVANLGAITGGIFFGHMSQFFGRRLTLIFCCVVGGALVYPWGFATSNAGINASAFFFQAMVQGAWGVIPIHLSELAPAALRAFVVGTSYQLGNLASSAASTIESKIGEQFPLPPVNGQKVYDYGKVMAILMGAVFGYVLIIAIVGPERRDEPTEEFITHEEKAYVECHSVTDDPEQKINRVA